MQKNLIIKTPHIQVPNYFIRYKSDVNLSALEMQMRLFLFIYHVKSFGRFGSYTTSLEYLLREIGLNGSRKDLKRTKYYSVLTSTLHWFIENDYIKIKPNQDLETISIDQIIEIYHSSSADKFSPIHKFTKLTMREYQTLINVNENRNKLADLHVYAYIKSLVNKRKENENIKDAPECCILSHEQISKYCKLSSGTIANTINHLKELNLLASQKPDNVQRVVPMEDVPYINVFIDKYFNTQTVYVLKNNNYIQELIAGAEKYINEIVEKYRTVKGSD